AVGGRTHDVAGDPGVLVGGAAGDEDRRSGVGPAAGDQAGEVARDHVALGGVAHAVAVGADDRAQSAGVDLDGEAIGQGVDPVRAQPEVVAGDARVGSAYLAGGGGAEDQHAGA